MLKMIRKVIKNKRGASLVEVIIALGLLGLIATTFLMAIFIATRSIAIADERTTAESLARTQMEYIKQQPYPDDAGSETEYYEINLSENPNYSIWSVNRDGWSVDPEGIVPEIIAVPWDSEDNLPAPTDVGLQKIRLKVYHDGKEVLTLEGYKVDEGIY